MGSRSSPVASFKKGHAMDELEKAGAYDVGASAGSSSVGGGEAAVTSPAAMLGGGAATKKPLRSSATAAPLSSPSIGGGAGVASTGAPSMAAPNYMSKQLGGMAARAGIEAARHIAHHVIPRYIGGAVGVAGAKAGYKGARKLGAKLANRLIARNKRLGRGITLTPRQKKLIVGTAISGSMIGGATGLAIGHHIAHSATQHVDRRITRRHGRPPAPGNPFGKTAVPGSRLMKQRYEGSAEDEAEDRRGAKRMGISQREYERTAQDRREDKAGEKRLGKRLGPYAAALGTSLLGGAAVGGAVAAGHKFKKVPRHDFLHHVGGLALFGPSYVGYRAGRAIGRGKPAKKQIPGGDLGKGIGGTILGGVLRGVESSAGRKIIGTAGKAGRSAMGMASSAAGGVKAAGSSLSGATRRGAMSAITSPTGTKAIQAGGRAMKSPAAQAISGGLGRAGRGASSFVGKHPYTSAAVVGTGLGMLARATRPKSDKQESGGDLEKNIASTVGRGLRRFGRAFASLRDMSGRWRQHEARGGAVTSSELEGSSARRLAWPKGTFPKAYPNKREAGDLESPRNGIHGCCLVPSKA
jgi:hypothetical protein